MKKTTFSNTISPTTPEPLPCGCIVGYFECAELQRLHSLRNDAYYRSDWEEYEKHRQVSWRHLRLEPPIF